MCGYQEGDHIGGMLERYKGDYKKMAKEHPKLIECSGYNPENEDGEEDLEPGYCSND